MKGIVMKKNLFGKSIIISMILILAMSFSGCEKSKPAGTDGQGTKKEESQKSSGTGTEEISPGQEQLGKEQEDQADAQSSSAQEQGEDPGTEGEKKKQDKKEESGKDDSTMQKKELEIELKESEEIHLD